MLVILGPAGPFPPPFGRSSPGWRRRQASALCHDGYYTQPSPAHLDPRFLRRLTGIRFKLSAASSTSSANSAPYKIPRLPGFRLRHPTSRDEDIEPSLACPSLPLNLAPSPIATAVPSHRLPRTCLIELTVVRQRKVRDIIKIPETNNYDLKRTFRYDTIKPAREGIRLNLIAPERADPATSPPSFSLRPARNSNQCSSSSANKRLAKYQTLPRHNLLLAPAKKPHYRQKPARINTYVNQKSLQFGSNENCCIMSQTLLKARNIR